ncbi:MAG: LuxR C-terminal-related transcriptional regulator [Erythrobacter sp.]|nr:LuxR C-terminal-related transcriptional regulator [Erythrobacter sp.]
MIGARREGFDDAEAPALSGLVVHVIDRSSRGRAEQAATLISLGCHAEVYDGLEEFEERPPDRGVVLCRDDDTSGGVAAVATSLEKSGIWLPVIGTAYGPELPTIVDAMKQGALNYLALPLRRIEVYKTIRTVLEEAESANDELQRILEARCLVRGLTEREREVLDLLVEGSSNKGIARQLGISPRTVEIHRSNMMRKLGAGHTAEAIRLGIEASRDLEMSLPTLIRRHHRG